MKHTSPFDLEGCQGRPFFWAFISTLDSPPSPHNGARNEAKRSSVQLRSMAEGFCFLLASSPKPDEHQTSERNCKIKLVTRSLNCRTATSTKGSRVIIRVRNLVRPNHLFGHNFDHD